MTRKKKTIIGCCVGLLLVIVACAVANRFATQVSCHQKEAMSTDADTLCPCPKATILLQPYDDFTQKEAYQLENELAKHFDDILYGTWTFKVLPTKKMSSQWYYKPRNRYRADKITKVSHLPFYGLLQIIASCNILIDSLLTFCK